MLPEISKESLKSNNYFFMPIHFRDHCLGYCVVCNCKFPMESALYHTCVMNISNSLENIRKILCLDRILSKLDQLSVIDPLVQIYNRNGFNKMVSPIYQKCIENSEMVMVMFIDMDDLKHINDKFGHKEGDFALQTIAGAIRSAVSEKEDQIPARFGGDEFILFAPCINDDAQADGIVSKITGYLDEINRTSGKPYEIHASIGYHITVSETSKKLDKLISVADQIMYSNKKKKKKKKNTR